MRVFPDPCAVRALIEIESGGISGQIKAEPYSIFGGIEGSWRLCKGFGECAAGMAFCRRFVNAVAKVLTSEGSACHFDEFVQRGCRPERLAVGFQMADEQNVSQFFDDEFRNAAVLRREQANGLGVWNRGAFVHC